MGHHKHQPTLTKTVFNGDAAHAECHILISRLLDKAARRGDEVEELRECMAALREERYSFLDTISAASNKIITLRETLLLVARSGACPLQESILQDMYKTTLDYANIRDAEKTTLYEENVYLCDQVMRFRPGLQKWREGTLQTYVFTSCLIFHAKANFV